MITDALAYELICSAFEDGIAKSYVRRLSCETPADRDADTSWMPPTDVNEYGRPRFPFYAAPLLGGETRLIEVLPSGRDVGEALVLDRDALDRGSQLALAEHPEWYSRILFGEWSAVEADNFIQLCLFGEVKYAS